MRKNLSYLLGLGALFPFVASAAIDSPDKVIGLVTKVGGWLYSALVAIAVVVIIYGAFEMLFSGGDAEKFRKGKNVVLYTIVAVAIAILATGVIKLIEQLVGAV